MEAIFHNAVLADESIELLVTNPDGIYVDCTLGGGGHSSLILRQLSTKGVLIGLDADGDAVENASQKLKGFKNKFLHKIFYDQLDVVLHELDKFPVDGILYDLGLSSFQVDETSRGFSYQVDAPLDMRFDQGQKLTAAGVLNTHPLEALQRIIREYGEDLFWKPIAEKIIQQRSIKSVQTTNDLVEIVRSVIGEKNLAKSLARIFQAVRIEVNQELQRLEKSLELAFQYLKKHGRLVAISYHSLEDRIVKEFFRYKALDCICPDDLPECICDKESEMRILTRKVVKPSTDEIRSNPRARSARLRAAEKIIPFTN